LSSVLQNISTKIRVIDENLTLDGLRYMATIF
jgi:hypothetical protein